MRMTPLLALAMAACSPQSTYTAAFLDFTPDASADPIRDVSVGNSDFGSGGDVAAVGDDGAVEVEVDAALGEDVEPEADVYTGPAGCAPPYGPCPESWECIGDAAHPLGGFCGCECEGAAEPHRCNPMGECFGAALTTPYAGDSLLRPTVADAGTNLFAVYDAAVIPDSGLEYYLPERTQFLHRLPGVVTTREAAEAACAADDTGGRQWKWRLPTIDSLSDLARFQCPDFKCDLGGSIMFPPEEDECIVHNGCWPFEPHDGDSRSFWTLDAYMLRFAPSGAVDPETVGHAGGVICRAVFVPDGKDSID